MGPRAIIQDAETYVSLSPMYIIGISYAIRLLLLTIFTTNTCCFGFFFLFARMYRKMLEQVGTDGAERSPQLDMAAPNTDVLEDASKLLLFYINDV